MGNDFLARIVQWAKTVLVHPKCKLFFGSMKLLTFPILLPQYLDFTLLLPVMLLILCFCLILGFSYCIVFLSVTFFLFLSIFQQLRQLYLSPIYLIKIQLRFINRFKLNYIKYFAFVKKQYAVNLLHLIFSLRQELFHLAENS